MSNERIHHPYSPSKLQSLESCPKYASAFTTSEAAEMGTKQHAVAETGIDDITIPDEKAAGVTAGLLFLDERRRNYPGHTYITEEYLPIDESIITVALPPDAPVGTPDKYVGTTAGYLDAGIISADQTEAEIVDFKFGRVAVERADNNLQGAAYALGLLKKYPTLRTITVWFVMPHRDDITGCKFDLEELDEMRFRIRVVVARAVEANKDASDFSTAAPNQGACMFCSHIGRCPKVTQIALNVGKKYAPLDIPESISTVVFTDPSEVANGLKLAAIIKTWAEAYRQQATAKSIKSDFIPEGYKLVSMSKRTIVDAKKLGELAKTFLPEEDREKVEALYDIPLTAVEKLISVAMPRGSKEAQVEAFGEAALAYGILKQGAPYAFLRQDNSKTEE
jgi:hypothetical protein